MTEQNLIPIKIDQIYIVQEDSNIFATLKNNPKNDVSLKIKSRLNDEINSLQLFSDDLRFLNGVSYLNLETFNIIDKHLKENQKLKSDGKIYKKLNKERLATIFKCLGFNIIYCLTIAENIFSVLGILINLKYEEFDKTDYIKTSVLVKQNTFYQIAKNVIKDLTGKKCRIRKYFNLSYLIVNKQIPIIILIGGTSGTGKSTVSSFLASRLGISTVLSTDTIRHIMRNFFSKEECGVLFSSTYEAWKSVKIPEEELAKMTIYKKTIKGYLGQSNLVGDKLSMVIDNIIARKDSVIVEGVHLTVDTIKIIMKKYKYTFPFLIYIEKEEKHKERFAIRSKQMTLDARYNKYIQHFEYIRTIQSYLKKKADQFLLPKIENTNIDKSIGMIQETILRSFKDIYTNDISNYNTENDNLSNFFNNFSKLSKTLLSSKEANILISQKPNKNFLLEKFLSGIGQESISPVRYNGDKSNETKENFYSSNLKNYISSKIKKQTNIDKTNFNLIDDLIINSPSDSNKISKRKSNKCLSDDEIISSGKSARKNNEINLSKNTVYKRINYQMESNINTRSKFSNINKFISVNTYNTDRKKIDLDDKDSTISGSLNKFGSIDSTSKIDRIKVINETEDEFDSIDERGYNNLSGASYGSISEEDEYILNNNNNINEI